MIMAIMDAATGLPMLCETDGCAAPATSVWSGGWPGTPRRACQQHNPAFNTTVALPLNFTSRSICHACGQPVSIGTQQVTYPVTAG